MMNDLIDQIMAADREANRRLAEAREKQAAAHRAVEQKKEDLRRSSEELIRKELSMMDAGEYTNSIRAEEEIGKKAAAEQARLRNLFEEHRQEWIASLVQAVLHPENHQ